MQINKKLLPIKGHFFFFNAGTAPLVPYLSTYARQLGFSSATVGLIYTILPLFGLIAKPLFGIIADKYKKQKIIFIFFQLIVIISFWSIYAIPEHRNMKVELDCDYGVTVLQSCYASKELMDTCKINSALSNQSSNATTRCQMTCDMTSPKMWQTVCEYWQVPQYCYSSTKNIQYSPTLSNIMLKDENCLYINASSVTMGGEKYNPRCRVEDDMDLNEQCILNCSDQKLRAAIGDHTFNMTCVDDHLNFKLCTNNTTQFLEIGKEKQENNCDASCDLDQNAPWRLMKLCEWWKADESSYCQPKTKAGEELPKHLSFTAVVTLSSSIVEHECLYMRLKNIEMPDGSGGVTTHYPSCASPSAHKHKSELFQSTCDIRCDDAVVNEIIEAATDSQTSGSSQYTSLFFIFFFLMITSWVGQAVVVTFADAICFELLGSKVSHYGKQRLWGSVGFGTFSLLTGVLIDLFSDGAYKDYTVAFVLMFIFMLGDVGVSFFLETDSTKMSMNILSDVGSLLSSVPTIMFLIWTIAVGMCTGLLWQFLFWLIEDISNTNCNGSDYVKTLQGLVSAIQTFGGEIPFLFVSGHILKKVGHVNMMSIVLLAFGVRFILYSFLTNAWWVLPIEMFQGITFGMFYPTMTSYANIVSPPGTETTVQGLVGAVFEGVGTAIGSFVGGRLYEMYGGWYTFQMFGIGALVCCAINWLAFFIVDKLGLAGVPSGYSSVIRYEQPNDLVYMLEDMGDRS
ncbi:unnamed protein product [Arctia plantaginis]|uniref:Major facilitator superfamily (MFS) profile domain-containing protein n=1 Tax=Arctia plantaginis TaxID=874455 RepID=A0A8S0Z364_ARCPL|nr:unnamed protein product [Arctia plantaginis]